MSGFYSQSTLSNIKNIKKLFQKIAVWIFIGGIVFGAIYILVNGDLSGEIIWKVLGTLLVLALALIISSNNFYRIESDEKSPQAFATIGLIGNVLWSILWILAIWEICALYDSGQLSFIGRITFISSELAFFGLIASNIVAIKEYDKHGVIFPLKVVATACLSYTALYGIIVIISSNSEPFDDSRLAMLAAFASVIWFVVTIVALVFSSSAKHKHLKELLAKKDQQSQTTTQQPQPQPPASILTNSAQPNSTSEEQMRAEIEQKVRAEMLEKEIRARLQNEQNTPSDTTAIPSTSFNPNNTLGATPSPSEISTTPTPQPTPPTSPKSENSTSSS